VDAKPVGLEAVKECRHLLGDEVGPAPTGRQCELMPQTRPTGRG
jgi:hypothetical protein